MDDDQTPLPTTLSGMKNGDKVLLHGRTAEPENATILDVLRTNGNAVDGEPVHLLIGEEEIRNVYDKAGAELRLLEIWWERI